jgi:hypothetical protein
MPVFALLSASHGTTVRRADGSYVTLPPHATIVRLDPRTLRPQPGTLGVGRFWGGAYVSPDRTQVALASQSTLRIVDLTRFRIERTISLGSPGKATVIRDVGWIAPDRLFAIVQRESLPYLRDVVSRTVVLVDPATGRILRRTPLTNKLAVAGSASAGGRYVFLLRSSSLEGSSVRLVVATRAGVRSVSVAIGKSHGALRSAELGLAPTGRTAFLFTSLGPIVSVDLRTLRVARHAVRLAPGTKPQPAAMWQLFGTTAGARTLVVGGSVASGSTLRDGGVYAVDTATWTARLLDPAAMWATYAAGVVLTYGPSGALPPKGKHGVGVGAFRLDGTRLYHVLDGESVYVASVVGDRVYAERTVIGPGRPVRQEWIAFDARTGAHLVRIARAGNMQILG